MLKITLYPLRNNSTVTMERSVKSVKEFISLITKFGEVSGLKINTQKTEALWLGDVSPFKLPNNIKWSNKPIKVLGAYIGWNLQEANRLTISKKVIDMRKMLFSWKHRKLTLNGRVLMLKSLAISQIIHLASLLPFPDDLIQEIEQMIYEFCGMEKLIKLKKMLSFKISKKEDIKWLIFVHWIWLEKLKWVVLYLNNHECLWRHSIEANIRVKNLNVFFKSNYDICENLTNSRFYMEVLKSLNNLYNIDQNNSRDNLENQFIFYNKMLKINKRLVYDEELFDAGLWRVCDMFDSNGNLIPFSTWETRGVSGRKFFVVEGFTVQS